MKITAIAVCRVSTAEQKQSNSLNRQQQSVLKAAEKLEVEIVKYWSGDVSSKAGTNVKRKDLQEMIDYCKKHNTVKYLIVDEPDRFMRSVDEAFHFEVEFRMVGVKVWYASDSELNTGNMTAKMMKFMKYFAAEGSNEERQRKSVSGHAAAIKEGRYTFIPKPGYVKGEKPGVHVPHPDLYEPLQKAFKEVASRIYTPQEALKSLNQGIFTQNHSPWKMDKFSQFAQDPYYAGIIVVGKQIDTRCEKGQHQAMLTIAEHEALVSIFSNKKVRKNHKKQYNSEFPMNNILLHHCEDGAKFTGSVKNNGHGGFYPKYHCRRCSKQFKRDIVHEEINNVLSEFDYNGSQRNEFIDALTTVYLQKQQDNLNHFKTLEKRRAGLVDDKSKLVREFAKAVDSFKEDLRIEIDKINTEIEQIKYQQESINDLQNDFIEFVKFALEYTNNLKEDWWQLNREERQQCQQILFPAGITINSYGKVGTNDICPLYRLVTNKKDLRISRKSLLVELAGSAPASIRFEKISSSSIVDSKGILQAPRV